ncbi:MAG: hypothetical protein R2939_20320 [Kofleriaceae bacterium]
MRGLSLDVLTVTDAADVVLAAPHSRAATGEIDPAAGGAGRRAGVLRRAPGSSALGRQRRVWSPPPPSACATAPRWCGPGRAGGGRRTARRGRAAGPGGRRVGGAVGGEPGAASWAHHGAAARRRRHPAALVELEVSDGGLDAVLARSPSAPAVLAPGWRCW